MTQVIDLNKPLEAQQIISDLVYSSYRYNRLRSPLISVKQWDKLFDVEKLEPRFQEEIFGKNYKGD